MPQSLTNEKSTLVQVMDWCWQATSHNLSQCWPRSMSPYDITRWQWVNSLGPSDAIWRQRSGSTLAQVMACCLTAPSHYLNQCWLIISKVSDIHLRASSQEIPQPSIIEIIWEIKGLLLYEYSTHQSNVVSNITIWWITLQNKYHSGIILNRYTEGFSQYIYFFFLKITLKVWGN